MTHRRRSTAVTAATRCQSGPGRRVGGQQVGHRAAQRRVVDRRRRGRRARADRAGQLVLVAPVAAQVEPARVVEHERRVVAGIADDRRRAQRRRPGRRAPASTGASGDALDERTPRRRGQVGAHVAVARPVAHQRRRPQHGGLLVRDPTRASTSARCTSRSVRCRRVAQGVELRARRHRSPPIQPSSASTSARDGRSWNTPDRRAALRDACRGGRDRRRRRRARS